MGATLGVLAFLVALVGLLVTLGNAGYLALLSSAARRRGITGESTLDYVRARRAAAGGLAALALLGLLLTAGGVVPDVLGLLLGGTAGVAGYRQLTATRRRFRGDG
jgi:hypothetical protein